MDPDQPSETPGTPAPAAPAAQPAETPAPDPRIEAEVKKARDAAWAEARRHYEGKAKGNQPKPETPPADTTPVDPFALRDAFDDATAEMPLTKGQRQLVRDAVMTKRPSDVEGFVKDYATKAGWGAAPTATNPTTPAATPPNARPASDMGAPAGTPAERSSDVTKWSQEDIERYYQQNGGIVRRGDDGSLDLSDPRNSKIHRDLRQMARQRLANVRIQLLDPRR